MKKNRVSKGYMLNTIIIVLLFTAFQLLTARQGGEDFFKLVLAPGL